MIDFDGFEPLSISQNEYDLLGSLRQISDRNCFEYGIAAHFPWVSEIFTSHARNYVDIPSNILAMDSISLYHAHTNPTLLSIQDLRLLLRQNIIKVCVITVNHDISSVTVGGGYRPDETEFQEAAKYIGKAVDMDLLDDPSFFDWTQEERIIHAICEQSYRIARHFQWTIEGGHYEHIAVS